MVLESSRLTLREAAPGDAAALAAYQADARYVAARGHDAEILDADDIVERARQWASEHPRLNYQLIVTLAAGGRVIGCVGVRQADHPCGEAEIGVELDPDHWGLGYAREALSRLVEFARDDLELTHLSALTTTGNDRAHRLLERMGFSPVPARDHETRFELRLCAART